MRSTLHLALLVCAGSLLPACGLFRSEPELPTLEEVQAARAEQEPQWQRLSNAYDALLRDPLLGWATVELMATRAPGDARLAAMIQDLRVEQQGEEAVRAEAQARYDQDPNVMNTWLLARRTPERGRRLALVEEALELQPGHQQAQVMRLALEAHVGNPEVLDDLIRLLRLHPGLAEGWRLLGEFAPLYARPELALRAAETEPWSPYTNPRLSTLALAEALLAGGNPERALQVLSEFPADDDSLAVLRAAAHAAAGRAERALAILTQVIARDPGNAIAHFNLGLLYRDYLPDPALSERHLQAYLDQSDLPFEQDLLRRVQAEYWLLQARGFPAADPPLQP